MRRFASFAAALAVFVSVGGVGPIPKISNAQGGCSGAMPPGIPITDPNYNRGITTDAEMLYFIDPAASADEEYQIDAAFVLWQTALSDAGKSVSFTRTRNHTLAEADGIEVVIGTTTPGDPASFELVGLKPQTYLLKAARITIDLRGGPMPDRLYFDPDLPGYSPAGAVSGAITKAMLHELGHTLGLHHFAGRACTEQQSGASVMNGMCGINDHGAVVNGVQRPPALANRPAPCDVAAVWALTATAARIRR